MSDPKPTEGKRWNGQTSDTDGGGKRLPENIAQTVAEYQRREAEKADMSVKAQLGGEPVPVVPTQP